MGFFDELPAPEPEPVHRHHPWDPPEAEFPGIVAMDTLVLARTEEVAVAVTGISAYSTRHGDLPDRTYPTRRPPRRPPARGTA